VCFHRIIQSYLKIDFAFNIAHTNE